MSRKILLIYNDAAELSRLSALLEEDYCVLKAGSPEQALETVCGTFRGLSAIVLEAQEQELVVLGAIRANAIWRQIPVVAVGSAGEQSRAVSLGANACLAAPADGALLKQLLANAISLCESASIANAMRRDKLTGLFNRETFFSEAAKLLKRHEPGYYTLACFDIDSFKVINDQYGTAKGDELIKFVADCINDCAVRTDGICCHHTADKYAMLFPTEYTNSQIIVENYLHVSAPPCINRKIKLRIGLYRADDLDLPVSAMFDRATLAGQSIKGKYGAYVAEYSEQLREKLLHEQEITDEMYDALGSGQFEPWFQPQYNHATGALIGAEALVRWRHPERGLVPPMDFIPVFERNGFIYELDKYIWEQVCVFLRGCLDRGKRPLPVSVNISRCDVFMKDFFAVITGLVEKYSIPLDLLRLEITESALAEGTGKIISIVKNLISFGFTVEIDDFGSGYSSLNTLKDVPAQILKLDMRFFEDTENVQRSGNIVESVVRMSKWLGMSVIAEGVESRQQADYLKSIGCYYIQGYYYARPMPLADYEALAARSASQPRLSSLETVQTYDNFNFWDPKSMDTLIFNSYVGGAIIIEYSDGRAEAIRVNDRFKQEFGGVFINGVPVSEMSPEECMDAENLRIMYGNIEKAIETGRESTCEVRVFRPEEDGGDTLYMRCTVRVIARAGNRRLLYCVVYNNSEMRAAQEKEAKARQKQLETADRLRSIMEHVGCGITAATMEGKRPRLLFANDRFYETLGYTRREYRAMHRSNYAFIHPEDREQVASEVGKTAQNGGTNTFECRALRRDGSERWLRIGLTKTRLSGIENPVELGVFEDISAEKKTKEQMLFLNNMASRLLVEPDAETGIHDALRRLMEYFGGKRAYVFELDQKRECACNSYEVCAPGVEPEKEKLQSVPLSIMKPWLHTFRQHLSLSIEDVDALEDSRVEERETLLAQNIKSLVAAPLFRDGQLIGFIGIDDTSRRQEEIENLAALGDYMAVMLTRRDMRSENQALLAIMGGVPGGFIRLQLMPDGGIFPVYLSENFMALVGMDSKQLLAQYAGDVRAGVHPDDLDMVQYAIGKMQTEGVVQNVRYRIRSGSGDYIWVAAFGKLHKSSTGEQFLNIYYADATEQKRTEELQSALLDNLPCGAALYELRGGMLSVIHINRRYWEMVGREPTDYSQIDFLNAVHPGDVDIIWRELDSAIRQKRDFVADIRVRYMEKEYRPFHLVGKPVLQSDGSYLIYSAYTPIEDNTMSLQEMLPIALSAMMAASPDYTFVKDKNLHYISISQSAAQLVGLPSERDIAGKSDFDVFDRETAERYRQSDRGVLQSGIAIIDSTEPLPMKDGTVRYGSVSKYPLRDALGNVVGLYCISRDITKLREAESQLKLLTDSIPGGLGIFEFGPDGGRTLYINEGFYRYSGFSREEYLALTADNPLAAIFDEDRPGVMAYLEALHSAAKSRENCVYRCRTKTGGYRWFSLSGSLAEVNGDCYTINVVQYDITEQKEAEQRLRTSEEEYRLATRQTETSICRFKAADRTLLVPASAMEQYDLPPVIRDIPYGRIKNGLVSPDTAGDYVEFYERILHGEKTGSIRYRSMLKGEWRWLEAYFTTIFDDDGKPVSAVISFRDITEQTEKELKTKKLAQTDPLTGVLNRKAFEERVTEQISGRSGAPAALLMLDLDGFKLLNDSFGHMAGDRTLIEVSRALRSSLKSGDMVCRLGGDEFMVFLSDAPDRRAIGERAQLVCQLLHKAASLRVQLSTSVGIAVCPDDGTDFEELYKKADAALYHVKANGKDSFAFYSPNMDT